MTVLYIHAAEVLTVSFLISAAIVIFGHRFFEQGRRNDLAAVQSAHVVRAPRIGGVAVVASFALGTLLWPSDADSGLNHVHLLVSLTPVLIVGLAEDLGFFASPRLRLIAAAVSGALFIALVSQWLPRAGVPGLNTAMQWAPFAIGFSIFLAVGISHAFNLIDGLNGLAGFTAVAAAIALAVIAQQAGLVGHRDALVLLGAAILGFLVLNFPLGTIFLGDAGAYVIGHVMVWTAISIVWNSPQITPWAMLLIFFWPVADTLLAIYRRAHLGRPISHPDRLHFHQLVMRAVEIKFFGRKKRRLTNPLATMITLPLALAPMVAGIALATHAKAAAFACLGFAVLFAATYRAGMQWAGKMAARPRNRHHRRPPHSIPTSPRHTPADPALSGQIAKAAAK